MKDRVPKYPGRVKLTPVSGQTNTYDLVRADEPIEEGSALNKANLLPDNVAEEIGLSAASNPQVKDALLGLNNNIIEKNKNNLILNETFSTFTFASNNSPEDGTIIDLPSDFVEKINGKNIAICFSQEFSQKSNSTFTYKMHGLDLNGTSLNESVAINSLQDTSGGLSKFGCLIINMMSDNEYLVLNSYPSYTKIILQECNFQNWRKISVSMNNKQVAVSYPYKIRMVVL